MKSTGLCFSLAVAAMGMALAASAEAPGAPAVPRLGSRTSAAAEPENVSGIYPSLACYNEEGECGTGAVVPWAGVLWVVTCPPHCPVGSGDKPYQITPAKKKIVSMESVGGTHAVRMIRRESRQLLIGTCPVDRDGTVAAQFEYR